MEVVGEKEKPSVSSLCVRLEINVPKWDFNGVSVYFSEMQKYSGFMW